MALAISNFAGLVSMAMMRPARALDDRESDATQPEHRDAVTRLHLRSVLHRAQARGDAASQQADLPVIGLGVDLRQRHLGDHGVFAEGGAAHVVVQRLALVREAPRAIRHHALALRGAHRHAQVGLAGLAEQALAAFGGVQRDHVVAGFHAGDPGPDLDHGTGALVSQHRGEQAFGIIA